MKLRQKSTSPPDPSFDSVNVKKHFKDRDVEALGGVYLEVAQGEFITLIGPSGSGKSTLLELLGDIGDEGRPYRRRYLIDGKTPEELRRDTGIWDCLSGINPLSLVSGLRKLPPAFSNCEK